MKLCVSLSPLLLYLLVSLRQTCLGDSMRRFNCNACNFSKEHLITRLNVSVFARSLPSIVGCAGVFALHTFAC